MKSANIDLNFFIVVVFSCLGLFFFSIEPLRADSKGRTIYLKQCASCHGESGQGVEGEYEDALYGDWSLGKIQRYIEKNMPEEDPDECVGEDAESVAKYIYQKFYSDEAKFRNAPKRIELARLTNRQYRESVSDLFVNLLKTNDPDGGVRHEICLLYTSDAADE